MSLSQSKPAQGLRPVLPFIRQAEDGRPYLEGLKCRACGTVHFGRRPACSNCFGRDTLAPVEVPARGSLYAYTIVHRSFPGVKTPFVHAVVDVEGGGALRGTLIDIEPDPKVIEMGMPVDIVFDDAGRTDAEGNHYLCYFFRPAGPAKGGK